jgi:hypothetical protein
METRGKKSNSMASISLSKEKKMLICCEEVVTISHSVFSLRGTQYQLVFLSSFSFHLYQILNFV